MDEQIYKNLKSVILKTINNGIAFTHMNDIEREDKEQEIVNYLKNKEYEVYIEECMIWVLGKSWEKLMMMELTRNTLYFTPFKAEEAPVIVYYILQFVSKEYLEFGLFEKSSCACSKIISLIIPLLANIPF